MELAIIIIAVVIYFIYKAGIDSRVDNYPIDRVDSSKMISDKVRNNLSDRQVQINMINGKYDKKK